MENPIKMDDLGVFPYFWFNTHLQAIARTFSQGTPPENELENGKTTMNEDVPPVGNG